MMIYEDKLVMVDLPSRPATKGHARVTVANATVESLSPEDFAHVLTAATFASSALFEQAGAHGTNIILSDTEGIVVDIVVRTEQDGLSLRWDPCSLKEEEMAQVTASIKERCDYGGVKAGEVRGNDARPTQRPPVPEREVAVSESRNVQSYLLRKLDRLP